MAGVGSGLRGVWGSRRPDLMPKQKCGVCRKTGHDKRKCPVHKENEKVKLELALTQRRYILESLDTAANLLQVPIVTAAVWFMLSRRTASLGVLNKAILAAELTPVIGDIKFPEGVLLGAAMESTEDLVDTLNKAGVLDEWEKLKEAVQPAAVTETILDFIAPDTRTCVQLQRRRIKLEALFREGPERGGGPGAWYPGEKEVLLIEYTAVVKRIREKCPDAGGR